MQNTQTKNRGGGCLCSCVKNKWRLVLYVFYLRASIRYERLRVCLCVRGWGVGGGGGEGRSGVVLQRWARGSWVGPVWSGACQGGPDSPMETRERDKLVRLTRPWRKRREKRGGGRFREGDSRRNPPAFAFSQTGFVVLVYFSCKLAV